MERDLERVSEETAKEIIRESEGYLSAQLAAGIGSDQRAATLSGVIATLGTAMLGGGLAVITGNDPNYALGLAGISSGVIMMIALFFAIHTARPVDFHYVGNCYNEWDTDEDMYGPLKKALLQQAKHYQDGIEKNNATLKSNARHLRRAVAVTLASPVFGSFIGLSIFLKAAEVGEAAAVVGAAAAVKVVRS